MYLPTLQKFPENYENRNTCGYQRRTTNESPMNAEYEMEHFVLAVSADKRDE